MKLLVFRLEELTKRIHLLMLTILMKSLLIVTISRLIQLHLELELQEMVQIVSANLKLQKLKLLVVQELRQHKTFSLKP
jgi:hypothetical protein